MAQTLWDKARVAVLGKMHSLLDEVANTPDAYKQRIRDLESAMADLLNAKDEAVGSVNGFQRQITEAQGKVANKQSDIDVLLGDDDPTNDDAAVQLQIEVEQLNQQIATWQGLQSEAQANVSQLEKANQALQDKHAEMVNALNHLTLTAASTAAKNKAADAVEAALSASDSAGSVDSIQANIDAAHDKANARFDRVFTDMPAESPEKAAAVARAKAALAARKAQITAGASSAVSTDKVTTTA